MKTLIKTSIVAALVLAATTFGAPQAQAHGWPIAAGVVGGVAVGATIGATVAYAAHPVYYAAPPAVYGDPSYYAPAPAVSVAVAPPFFYGPRVVYHGPYYPYGRVGFGWGPRFVRGGHFYRR